LVAEAERLLGVCEETIGLPRGLLLLGGAELHLGQLERAERRLAMFESLGPEALGTGAPALDREAHLHLITGTLALHRRAWEEAESHYGRALELHRLLGSPWQIRGTERHLEWLDDSRTRPRTISLPK
jgi:hypothetical protein